MSEPTKMAQVAKLVATMKLPELAEFCAMFHINIPIHQMMEAVEGAGISLESLTDGPLMVKLFKNDKKIQCIKAIRVITGIGLKEAKDFMEAQPDENWFTVEAIPGETKQGIINKMGEIAHWVPWEIVED